MGRNQAHIVCGHNQGHARASRATWPRLPAPVKPRAGAVVLTPHSQRSAWPRGQTMTCSGRPRPMYMRNATRNSPEDVFASRGDGNECGLDLRTCLLFCERSCGTPRFLAPGERCAKYNALVLENAPRSNYVAYYTNSSCVHRPRRPAARSARCNLPPDPVTSLPASQYSDWWSEGNSVNTLSNHGTALRLAA